MSNPLFFAKDSSRPGGGQQRIPLGSMPAVPFEIVSDR